MPPVRSAATRSTGLGQASVQSFVMCSILNIAPRLHIFVGSYFHGVVPSAELAGIESTSRISTSYFAARLTITTPTMNSAMPAEERNALIFERFIR
jgi:hypothetical protein